MYQKILMATGVFLAGFGMIWKSLGESPLSAPKQEGQQDEQQDKDQEPEKTVKPKGLDNTPFMTRKLDAARNVVSGLATEDYEMIAKSASDLNLLSQESQWEVFQTDQYIRMSNDFRDSAVRLRDAARDKNLDGATLAYFEVTLNCVRCHKYIRTNPR